MCNLRLGLNLDVPFSRKSSWMPSKHNYHSQTVHLTNEITCLLGPSPSEATGSQSWAKSCSHTALAQPLPCSNRHSASICSKNELIPLNKHVNNLGLLHFSHDLDLVKYAMKRYEWTEILMAKLRIGLKGPKMNKARLALKR